MTDHLRALRGRLSQRGACLLILAAVDVIYAYGLAYAPSETRATPTYSFLAALLPLPVWASIWAAVGGICLVQAWTRRDRVAYAAATALKVGWALLHLGAWAFGVLPRGYVSAAIWLLGAGFVMIVATVPKGGRSDW
ncbi:hypothetical protein [Streptosporangium roseum]|uniref:hypothetical protein n=1 Tax=Streptosporangium roseum TaxID=2001 RepID=UPI0004CD4817|nr:hypothetical protein [Streptosporangium roseum]